MPDIKNIQRKMLTRVSHYGFIIDQDGKAYTDAEALEVLLEQNDRITALLPGDTGPMINSGELQIILGALYKLREERPGWDAAIRVIEIKLGGQLSWPAKPAPVAAVETDEQRGLPL